MSARRARLSLRYRPGPDVLSGQVDTDLADLGPTTSAPESPDADSSVVWSRPHGGPDSSDEFLSSFHLIHASARWQSGAWLPLPTALTPIARDLMASGARSLELETSTAARVRTQVETATELPLEALRRRPRAEPATVPPADVPICAVALAAASRARLTEASTLSASLVRLGAAIAARSARVDEHQALRADQLARLLQELASTIGHGRGRTAPGTSAATRAAVREGVPLTAGQQVLLLQALVDVDTPSSWWGARSALDSVAASLESPPLGHRS